MSDYIINKAGAKVFFDDSSKHKMLEVPVVNSTAEKGKVYKVLSVGFTRDRTAIATIKEGSKVTAYRLPSDLDDWVFYSVGQSQQGLKPFPAKIEFGKLNDRMYAEIL